jgi:chromosomal replication initiator protein
MADVVRETDPQGDLKRLTQSVYNNSRIHDKQLAQKKDVWTKSLSLIKDQLDSQIYSAWIKPLSLSRIELDLLGERAIVEITAPNKFCHEHVKQNYGHIIANTLADVTGSNNIVLRFKVATSPLAPSISSALSKNSKKVTSILERKKKRAYLVKDSSNLNPKYHFGNFVVGACNQFAHAVSMRVSENLGSNYNPLFIYGGVGLGKTHLANAIGNTSRAAGKKVLVISSETFVNELISSLRSNKMQEFKDRFRSLDLLIIDDIQFIIGKERTQEEFFHTFNALHNRHSQIVITSDKVPQDLTGLEERLQTRFSSGISADLQAPDFETRVAILIKKSEAQGFSLPDDVARLLAEKIDSNVRELEGALNRLHAYSSLHNTQIGIELAEEAIRSIIPERTREITTELIQKTVAEKYNLSIKDLIGKRRTQHIIYPRQIAMYLCRRLTTCSYPEIGGLFGGRDHSTVIHANKVIVEKLNNDIPLKKDIESLEKRLKG